MVHDLEIQGAAASPNPVDAGRTFLVKALPVQRRLTWGDVSARTWAELASKRWE